MLQMSSSADSVEKLMIIENTNADFQDEHDFGAKRCFFTIKESALIKKMRELFNSRDYKSLTLDIIKNSFTEIFHCDSLHVAAIKYLTERIISEASQIHKNVIFYRNFFRKNSSFIDQPNNNYFFVDNDIYSFVKRMLKCYPVVKVERIFLRNKKIVKKHLTSKNKKSKGKRKVKVCDEGSKKCLKINVGESVLVEKNSFELAKKALGQCVVTLPVVSKLEKMCRNITVEQSDASPRFHESGIADEAIKRRRHRKKISQIIPEDLTNITIQSQQQAVEKTKLKKVVRITQRKLSVPQKKIKSIQLQKMKNVKLGENADIGPAESEGIHLPEVVGMLPSVDEGMLLPEVEGMLPSLEEGMLLPEDEGILSPDVEDILSLDLQGILPPEVKSILLPEDGSTFLPDEENVLLPEEENGQLVEAESNQLGEVNNSQLRDLEISQLGGLEITQPGGSEISLPGSSEINHPEDAESSQLQNVNQINISLSTSPLQNLSVSEMQDSEKNINGNDMKTESVKKSNIEVFDDLPQLRNRLTVSDIYRMLQLDERFLTENEIVPDPQDFR